MERWLGAGSGGCVSMAYLDQPRYCPPRGTFAILRCRHLELMLLPRGKGREDDAGYLAVALVDGMN